MTLLSRISLDNRLGYLCPPPLSPTAKEELAQLLESKQVVYVQNAVYGMGYALTACAAQFDPEQNVPDTITLLWAVRNLLDQPNPEKALREVKSLLDKAYDPPPPSIF